MILNKWNVEIKNALIIITFADHLSVHFLLNSQCTKETVMAFQLVYTSSYTSHNSSDSLCTCWIQALFLLCSTWHITLCFIGWSVCKVGQMCYGEDGQKRRSGQRFIQNELKRKIAEHLEQVKLVNLCFIFGEFTGMCVCMVAEKKGKSTITTVISQGPFQTRAWLWL